MSKYPQTVRIQTTQGDAEAAKDAQGEPWQIGYPWGDERFYGTEAEVRARMTANIATNDRD